jgi:hypothetical protein
VRSRNAFFEIEEPLQVYLNTDYRLLYHDRKDEKYQPAALRIEFPDQISIDESIQVKARGVYRKEYCSMPPISLNLKKARNPDLRKLQNIKMVVGCDKSTYSEQLIVKEYLTYRIYNLLTDKSFRVQLCRFHFVESGNTSKSYGQLGFLIENVDQMARRVSCLALNPGYRLNQLSREQTNIMNVFEYMIGNTDFTYHLNRNIKLLRNEYDPAAPPMPVPYDFDYSGLVNARYAIPHPDYRDKIATVRDRLYLGLALSDLEIDEITTLFLTKEHPILELIRSQQELSDHNKKEMLDYIGDFYQLLRDHKQTKQVFSTNYYDGL